MKEIKVVAKGKNSSIDVKLSVEWVSSAGAMTKSLIEALETLQDFGIVTDFDVSVHSDERPKVIAFQEQDEPEIGKAPESIEEAVEEKVIGLPSRKSMAKMKAETAKELLAMHHTGRHYDELNRKEKSRIVGYWGAIKSPRRKK